MADRQTLAAAAKKLEKTLDEKRLALNQARAQLETYEDEVFALEAEVKALTEAYSTVKPQPRTRTKRTDVTNG